MDYYLIICSNMHASFIVLFCFRLARALCSRALVSFPIIKFDNGWDMLLFYLIFVKR
jgi:hypothetical protein